MLHWEDVMHHFQRSASTNDVTEARAALLGANAEPKLGKDGGEHPTALGFFFTLQVSSLLFFLTFRLCQKLRGAAAVPVMKGFSEAAAERLLFLMASDCGSSQSAFLQLMGRRQKSSITRLLNHFSPFGRRRGRPLDGSPAHGRAL